MSFSLDLHAGAIKALYLQQPTNCPKPILQILRLQKLETFQTKLNSERYKLLLSDGVHYMQAVLSPKLNPLVFQKHVCNNSIVKLIEYDLHLIKGKKLLVILSMEEIVSCFASVLGSPVSIENAAKTLDMEEVTDPTSPRKEKPLNSLSADFLHLLNNPELSDITFILTDNQRCFAHKNILVSRSPYFRSMLMNGMKESFLQEIFVQEWEPQVFKAVLHFIYCDQIVLNQSTTMEYIWRIIMASKYFGLDRLGRLCEQYLINERINLETVCLLWNSANELDAKLVERACIRYLEQNFEQIANTDYFLILPKELLLYILESEELVASQNTIVEVIQKWAKAQMDANGLDNISKQDIFCQFLTVLRLQRKWNPTTNIADIKNSVLEALKSAGEVGLRMSRLVDKLKETCSSEDIR